MLVSKSENEEQSVEGIRQGIGSWSGDGGKWLATRMKPQDLPSKSRFSGGAFFKYDAHSQFQTRGQLSMFPPLSA